MCTIIPLKKASEDHTRQGHRHDDYWAKTQFPREVQGMQALVYVSCLLGEMSLLCSMLLLCMQDWTLSYLIH